MLLRSSAYGLTASMGLFQLIFFSLPSLHSIYLQRNYFSGGIPSSFSPHLSSLDLSFNSLEGTILSSIGNFTHLTKLYLQNNSFVGPIPKLKLPLKYLNLSNNHLSGSIPSILRNFSQSSFEGNIGLCGTPLSPCSSISPKSSPSIPGKNEASWTKISKVAIVAIAVGGAVALILIGGAVALILILLIILLCCLRKKDSTGGGILKGKAFAGGRSLKPKEEFGCGVQEAEKNKLVFFEGCSFNFDLEDLLRASAEVLGKVSYRTTYKAILEDGNTMVVKRLKEVVVGKKEFDQQMEVIGKVGQHQNVVPLRAYYYSKDEKPLVYDYVAAGSLLARLHWSKDTERIPLSWEFRFKILLGAARGIMHIHSSMGRKITHGNIKSSNVLLSDDHNGIISDFGLTPLMNFAVVPLRTAGYRAPETIETRKPTHKSDVYSFGVHLLEMLTGKKPVQSPGREEAVDLPRWVQLILREEWTSEVFDVELMVKNEIVEEELVQMLQIAMACVSKVPDMRPDIEGVVSKMEEIRSSDSSSRPSPEESWSMD